MSAPKVELLRQALLSVQAHAAGMHASAEMALRLLGEIRSAPGPQPRGPMYGGRPAAHYGDPEPVADEIEQHLGIIGGIAPSPASSGNTPPSQE